MRERLVLYLEREGPGLRSLVDGWLANARVRDRVAEAAAGPGRTQDAWDAPSAVVLAAAGAGNALLPGPLPPLPRTVVARPLAKAPSVRLVLLCHAPDQHLETFVDDIRA
jgi:hypothetical protein